MRANHQSSSGTARLQSVLERTSLRAEEKDASGGTGPAEDPTADKSQGERPAPLPL